MYNNKSIAIIVPCYNEQTQIGRVIETMPDYVDKMVIVDDCSKDNSVKIIESYIENNSKVSLIKHNKNQGCGGALATGYKWACDNNIDIAVRIDADGQMAPKDMPAILDPVVNGEADYAKGNRLFTGEAYKIIPKIRYFGNSILSLLTKIASGYWHIADSQTGYTAINNKSLKLVDWDSMYKRYGQPNDLLIMLNVLNTRVKDVPITPVYNVGEKSGIKLHKVIFSISWLLFKRFLWRMKEKYIIRDFHPLVFFYFFGFIFGMTSVGLFMRVFYRWLFLELNIPPINALAAMFSFMSASLFTLFAMWFDMEENKHLKG
tara:strand:+ start:600 stop:1553 length:954 start_codon:yes stop_codon:yes gene_type:complete